MKEQAQNSVEIFYPTKMKSEGAMVPSLEINVSEDSLYGRGPMNIATININSVNKEETRTGRFFVSIGVGNDNKPYVQLTAVKSNKQIDKTLTGQWLNFEKRLAEALAKTNS